MPRFARRLGVLGLAWIVCLGTAHGQEPAGDAPGKKDSATSSTAKGSPRRKTRGRREAPKKAEARPEGAATAPDGPSFARDVAPILAANCTRCHGANPRRGGLDQSTFRGLQDGGEGGPVIVAGQPDQSRLLLAVRGDGEGGVRKMPPGNDRISPEAAGKIEAWIKAGARLDAGLNPAAKIDTYLETPERRERARLAKMAPNERDKLLEDAARERWAKADKDATPEMTPGTHFALFGNISKERAGATLKALEGKYTQLRPLLSRDGRPAMDWSEKVSLYVFKDRPTYIEFVRAVEQREVDRDQQAHANLAVAQPYLAAIDPLGGKEEPAPAKKAPRTKKAAADAGPGPDRSLVGLLSEQLGIAATDQAGKAPRWLSLGIGATLAAQADPRSPYVRKLRATAAEQVQLGWQSKAPEALGGETSDDKIRAVGYAVLDFLGSEYGPAFPYVVKGMLEGGEKLDDVIGEVLGANRQQFLEASGEWIFASYGSRR